MNNENKVLKALKPTNRVLSVLSILLGLYAIATLVIFNFADVITIITDEGTKYSEGFSYPGYQTIFAGFGNMIIQGYSEAGFNIWMCLGMFLPLIGCIVATVMLITNFSRKGTNKKRAVVEGVVALLLIFGGIVLFNVDKFWISSAKAVTDSYTDYYATYLKPAMEGELFFGKCFYPTYTFIICLMAGVVKLVNCGILLFQKYYARKVKKEALAKAQ